MAKIIKIKNDTKFYLDKSSSFIEQDDFSSALIEANNAIRAAKTRKEKKDSYIAAAKLLNLRFKFEYSNELLYKALMLYPNEQEIKMMIMFNLFSLDDPEPARYYYSQIKPYMQKRRDENKELLMEALRENGFHDANAEEIIKPFDINIEKILEGEKSEGHFTLHDHTEHFNKVFDQAVDNIKAGRFEEALPYIEKALSYKVRREKKALAYYSKALCLYNLGEYNQAKEVAIKGFEVDINNINLKLIYCETLSALKEKKELIEKLNIWFLDLKHDDYQHIRRIVLIYMKNELWKEAISFLNKRSDFMRESYEINEYLGVCYFNMGNPEKAKAIFNDMYDLYGEVCNAKYFLDYIVLGYKDGIPAEAVFGDWPELNKIYLNYLYEVILLNQEKFIKKIIKDADKIVSIIKWLSQGIRSSLLYEFIDRIMATFSSQPRVNTNLLLLKQKIMQLICLPGFFDDLLKMQIVFSMLKYQVFKYISICVNNYLLTIKISVEEIDSNYSLSEACYLACAIAMLHGEKEYYKTEETAKMVLRLAREGKITWRSVGAIAALILEISIGASVNEIDSKIKCNYTLKRKYEKQLNDILSEESQEQA